jgi:signal recognition particle subunit SRP54
MFESLSEKLDAAFRKLKGHGKLSEKNIEDGLKEVRMALLEADVHYGVTKRFIAGVKKTGSGPGGTGQFNTCATGYQDRQ